VGKAIRGWDMALLLVAVAVAKLSGVGEVTSLAAGALVGMVWLLWRQRPSGGDGASMVAGIAGAIALGRPRLDWLRRGPWLLAAAGAPAAPTLLGLGLFFLKVGFVLYGTGYVLLAYLEGGLVDQYQWLEMDQLVEAVAIGQLTPGPILSTATFIGYVVMAEQGGHALGVGGAVVSTVCIFLPAFLLVAAINPVVPRLRKSRITAAFLDAVNAASLGLMAAVAIRLAALILLPHWRPDYGSVLIAALATAVAFRWNPRPAWIVMGGAAAGWLVNWVF
jgi:chromate transporter